MTKSGRVPPRRQSTSRPTAARAEELIQATLDSYAAGINIVRVNLDKADPPREVIDSFREVQAAEQERDRLERQADAYANRVLAGARGEAAQKLEEAEAYRAQVVNEAEGEASRFSAVLSEYQKAPEVTRKNCGWIFSTQEESPYEMAPRFLSFLRRAQAVTIPDTELPSEPVADTLM